MSLTPAQRKASRDPNKPKRWMTAYFIFLNEKRADFSGIGMTVIAQKVSGFQSALVSQAFELCAASHTVRFIAFPVG
jgi:hypothetical protein